MNPDTLVQMVQKGVHITLGATSTAVESLQDSQKRQENWSKLNLGWDALSEEWAQKGQQTEQEARAFVDTLLAQRGGTPASAPPASPSAPPDVQQDIQDLTEQLVALRTELEQLRNAEK
jgi:polyhydroxyalkanoate synthesis regulator phasin